jgi:hypothetical protein
MLKSKFFHSVALLFVVQILFAQADEANEREGKKLHLGLNAGGFMAHRHPAFYYAGYNEYGVRELLQNQFVYNQLFNRIQTPFKLSELPLTMRYRPAMCLGIYIELHDPGGSSFILSSNFSRLKTSGVFVLEADDPVNPSGQKDYINGTLIGEENRLNINCGLHFDRGTDETYLPYFEIGLNFTAISVVKYDAQIFDLKYPLGYNSFMMPQTKRNAIGYGVFASSGLRLNYVKNIVVDAGAAVLYQRLGLIEIKPAFKPSFELYLRFIYR